MWLKQQPNSQSLSSSLRPHDNLVLRDPGSEVDDAVGTSLGGPKTSERRRYTFSKFAFVPSFSFFFFVN